MINVVDLLWMEGESLTVTSCASHACAMTRVTEPDMYRSCAVEIVGTSLGLGALSVPGVLSACDLCVANSGRCRRSDVGLSCRLLPCSAFGRPWAV